MPKNFAKSPLMALFLAPLLCFAAVFVPFSSEHTALYEGFEMPLTGYLFVLAFALWVSLASALVFSASNKKSWWTALMLFIALLGTVWAVPMTESLVFDAARGRMGLTDALFTLALGGGCTALAVVLAVMLFKTGYVKSSEDGEKPARGVRYKLNIFGLVVRVIGLPILYCVLYFAAWYFLNWTNPEVRAFYEGTPNVAGIIPAVVNVLLYDTWMFYAALIKGLAYALFALSLLFLLPGRRFMFAGSLTLCYLSGAVSLLIPTPYLPDAARMSSCIFNAALLLVYGAAAGFLLYTSYIRLEAEPVPEPEPEAPAKPRRIRRVPVAAAPSEGDAQAVEKPQNAAEK